MVSPFSRKQISWPLTHMETLWLAQSFGFPSTMNSLRSLLATVSSNTSKNGFFSLLPELTQVRFRRVYRLNLGHPHPLPPGKVRPEPNKYNWVPIYPPDGKYTIMPLKIQKLGGRHPETGRMVVATIGGGNKKYFRWIDYVGKANPDGTPRVEKVYKIRYDPLRTTKLALVAGGNLANFNNSNNLILFLQATRCDG